MNEGVVFNIQNYAIHDGPGIRTTVFLKGCPLSCWWCHNPESQEFLQQILYIKNRCIECGTCLKLCPDKTTELMEKGMVNDTAEWSQYERCIEKCPAEAIELVGKRMSVAAVMAEVEKDRIFYDQSGGGVTFSGGEPLFQIQFLKELLAVCKEKGLHTALDTSGYATWDAIACIEDKVDLFLYDIKLMDDDKHKKYTGVSNRVILDNLRQLAKRQDGIWVRIPVIPGINDDDGNIRQTGAFLKSLGLRDVFLLPYHKTAVDKYERLRGEYRLLQVQPPSDKDLRRISEQLEAFGLNIKIGG